MAGAGTYFEVPPRASIANPKDTYLLGTIGPSYSAVEQTAQWMWAHPGGDWINQSGTAQGTSSPHFTFTANSVTSVSASYSTSITAGATAAFARGKWNAYIVVVTGSGRALATQRHATLAAPRVQVTYTDSTTATLACLACVQLQSGTSYTQIGDIEAPISPSVALEFQMPTKAVASATLTLAVTQHTSGSATISGYLANPPVNTAGVTAGVAAAYPADAGLKNHASILFAQRYEDGTTL